MGDLTDWVSVSSQTSCKEEFDILKGIGLEPLKAFLTKYPLDDRTIYGGKIVLVLGILTVIKLLLN